MTPNERLKQARLELNLSQTAFAHVLGLKQGSYSDVERGKVNISKNVLSKLEKMGINPSYVTNGTGNPLVSADVTLRDRFLSALNKLGIKLNASILAAKLAMNNEDFSFLVKREDPSEEVVDTFLYFFPQVNSSWLKNGTGNMLRSSEKDVEILSREIVLLRESLRLKEELLMEKTVLINSLNRQIEILQSFIPAKPGNK